MIASVNPDADDPTRARVYGNAPGQTLISVSGGGWSASTKVVVKGVSSISLSKASLNMSVGDKATFTATVSTFPTGETSWPVRWSSSSSMVASVDTAGVVTALRVGKTQLRASAGQMTALATVTVTGTALVVEMSGPDSLVGTVQQDDFGYFLLCKFPPLTVSASGDGTAQWWDFYESINGATVSHQQNFPRIGCWTTD
jgi:hypothetical protein